MEEEYYEGFPVLDSDPTANTAPEQSIPKPPEALTPSERYTQVPLFEYDLKDLQPVHRYPSCSTDDFDDYFDPDDFELANDRKLYTDQKVFQATPRDGDLPIWLTNADEHDHDEGMLHVVGVRTDNDTRLISPAFDELLESTPTHIRFLIGDKLFQISKGAITMRPPKHAYMDIPECLDPQTTVLFSELVPLDDSSNVNTITLMENHWEVLEAPVPSRDELEQIQQRGNELFDASVLAIYSHVERNPLKYAGAEDISSALRLPAIPLNGRYYQVTVSSSEISTTLSVQRVHPESPQQDISNALERISVQDFTRLLENPEELEQVMNEALSEGRLLLTQRPYSDVLIIGGDNYDKRLDYTDAGYTTIVTNIAKLIKSYVEELDILSSEKDTLYDKRRALAEKVRAEQEAANKSKGKMKRFGKTLLRLFLEN
jgi:hypothetical protein